MKRLIQMLMSMFAMFRGILGNDHGVTTWDETGGAAGSIAAPTVGGAMPAMVKGVIAIKRTVDLTGITLGASDVVQCIPLPIGFRMGDCAVNVRHVGGAGTTSTVGDTATANGWIATLDLTALGWTVPAGSETFAAVAKKLYTSATASARVLNVTVSANATGAIFDIYAIGVLLN